MPIHNFYSTEITRANADIDRVVQLDKQLRLAIKIRQDLVMRAKQGVWSHPLCAAMVLATTGLPHRAPALSWSFAGAICLLSLMRIAVLHRVPEEQTPIDSLRVRLYCGLLIANPVPWSIFTAAALARFGYLDKDVLVLVLYHAVISFATVNVHLQSQKLIAVALGMLFIPPYVGALLHGGADVPKFLGTWTIYLLYCIGQSRRLNQLYTSHLSDNWDLSVAAYRDSLTGVPNRLYVDEALEGLIAGAARNPRPVALLYIDLDGFKAINDNYSHKVGDLVLREAASRFRRCLRKTDIVARIGGDEFVILLLEGASEREALRVATQVLTEARAPVIAGSEYLYYTASIGISLFPSTAKTPDKLIHTADEAMYNAKCAGKDRICIQLAEGASRIAC